jgi:NMD protein affecting ribosome stability and mRNA decay
MTKVCCRCGEPAKNSITFITSLHHFVTCQRCQEGIWEGLVKLGATKSDVEIRLEYDQTRDTISELLQALEV